MKQKIAILFFILISFSAFSQKYSFGKISEEEWDKKQSLTDVEAPAEILYKEIFLEVDLHGYLEIKVTERVKVYDKNRAEQFLTYEVPLHKNGNLMEKVSGFRASTYNKENGNVVETKVKNDQVFTEEKHKYQNLYKFTFPNVKDNSVLEYKYTIYSPWIQEIPVQYFDYKIPVKFISYRVKAPAFITYVPDFRGLYSRNLKVEQTTQEAVNIPYNIVSIKAENLKAYEEEPFVLNYNNIRTSIRYELAGFTFPGKQNKNFSTTWKEVGETLLKSSGFGSFYQNTRQFSEILPSVIEGRSTKEEKAKSILKYVQENYVWNEYGGVYADQSLSKVIKTRTGNSGDLNLLLVAMLREAGIDANPIVLSTVSNGMLNYAFPSLQKLNYVIAGYYDGKKLNIMDATNKYSEINQVPKRVLNYRGFYIQKGNIHEVDLSNTTMSTEVYILDYEIKGDMEFVGTLTNRSNQYLGMNKIEEYEEDKNNYEKKFRKKYSFPLQDLEFTKNRSTFKTSFSFDSASNAELVGQKVVFNPLLFLVEKEQVFKSEKRIYPVELGSPYKSTRVITIKIPEGYKIETLPKSKKYMIEGNLGTYNYIISTSGNQVQLKTELIINVFYLIPEYYSVIKEFWQHMIEEESQLISLVRE